MLFRSHKAFYLSTFKAKKVSDSEIFKDSAPTYWKAGLPVFPLWPRKKEPLYSGWREYSLVMPSVEQQNIWLDKNPSSNIGLPLGPCSNIGVIDIDTDDQAVVDAILEALPMSNWIRKGKKGAVLAYRFNPALRTFRIRTRENESIVEYLSEGTYVVLPPSIHPDTQQQYVANAELIAVSRNLQMLPNDIEDKLRKALEKVGVYPASKGTSSKVTEFVPAGARDVSLTRMAGLFAFAVLRGERTLLEALEMLQVYANQYVQNVVGDPIDMDKHRSNLVKFLTRDVLENKRILPEGWDSGMTDEERKYYRQAFNESFEEKPCSVILEDLKVCFEEAENNATDEVMTKVEQTLKLMAFSQNLSSLDTDRIITLIVREAGLGVKASSLLKQIKSYKTEGLFKGENHTEIAQKLIEDLKQINELAYANGNFFRWCGSHYEVYEPVEIEKEIHLRYGDCIANKKKSDTRGILSTMSALLAVKALKEENIIGVNFANGFLIKTLDNKLELQPHDTKYGATYTLPFCVDLKKTDAPLRELAPNFHLFLETCWGVDDDYKQKVDVLQEALLVTLLGLAPQYQRAFLLYGVAASGKSQLLTIVSSLVPPEAKCAVSPDKWADEYATASMSGRLLNIAGELSETKRISGQVFKEVVDGSEMSVREPYGKHFITRMIAAQWFAGNFLPKTKDTSDGFSRRWVFLQFNHPIPEAKRQAGLGDLIVLTERAGIVQWALGALPRLVANNSYTLPLSHTQCIETMSNLNNPLRAFFNSGSKEFRIAVRDVREQVLKIKDYSRILTDKFGFGYKKEDVIDAYNITEAKLYELYWAWTLTNTNSKPQNLVEFRQGMAEVGITLNIRLDKENSKVPTYKGVAANNSALEASLEKIGLVSLPTAKKGA